MDAGSETQQRDALSEGRRIYVGNLLYSVQPGDVEDLLRQVGFEQSFEKLHISIDPISGRNPGYCFAEFISKEEADRALDVLPGNSIMNRAVKVGPCNPKTSSQPRNGGGRSEGGYTPTFNRWGDWKGDDSKAPRDAEQGPYGAVRHLDNRSRRGGPEKAQLYIGGLGMMTSQAQHDTEMQELLEGFEYVAIGKRITPRVETRTVPGNHHYCFVDFSTADEAERALNELNGKAVEGGTLRVSLPKSKGPAFDGSAETNHGWKNHGDASRRSAPFGSNRRQESSGEDGQEGQEAPQRREPTEKQRTIMTSSNWRSAAPSS